MFTLTGEGVLCSGQKGEEVILPYKEVRFYRTVQRRSASDIGRAKLYFTAALPFAGSYNRYCFQEDGKRVLTHEFTDEEKKRTEKYLARFSVSVIDRRLRLGGVPKASKSFCEDGGITHRLLVGGGSVLGVLLLGVIIMYLLNYFLNTETESLAMVFGIFCVPCLAVVLIKAQELGSTIKVYDRGVFLKIRVKTSDGTSSPFAIYKAFFAWDEVESIERIQSQVEYCVCFRLGYCVYTVPDFNGLFEYLTAHFPEKCKREEA